jgi:hypothetical protein
MESSPDNDDSRSRLAQSLEIDRAVLFGLATRVWQFIAGPVTTLMIASYFSDAVQGYFYTFASLLALQSFVELGLHTIIIFVTSHEWAHLELDDQKRLRGDPVALSRLTSFAGSLIKWYGIVSVAFLAIVGIAGIVFFSQDTTPVAWLAPWLALVGFSGISLFLIPFIGLLEGCNQVTEVNRFRFFQALAGNIAVWSCLALNGNLWTAVAGAAVKTVAELLFVTRKYRAFFQSLKSAPIDEQIDWQADVWPLQWRMGLQSFTNFFSFTFVTPVVFQFHGPEEAGRMGMTWTILAAIQGASAAWLQVKTPTLGVLVSKNDYQELNRLFRKVTTISVCILVIGTCLFAGCVETLHWLRPQVGNWGWMPEIGLKLVNRLPDRLLEPAAILLFGMALTVNQFLTCCGTYIRAHKIDPLLTISCSSNLLIGVGILMVTERYSATGAGAVCLAVLTVIALPGYLFMKSKVADRQNHSQEQDHIGV